MKNVFSRITDAVLLALLTPCVFWCIASSFSLNLDLLSLFVCSFLSSALFSLFFLLVKRKRLLFAGSLLMIVLYVLFIVLKISEIVGQLEYAVNGVLGEYSKYLPVQSRIIISENYEHSATLLFILLEILLLFFFTASLVKIRSVLPIVLISGIFLVPCFILVNTCPSVVPLFIVLALCGTLIIVSSVHKHSLRYGGVFSIGALAVIFGILLSVFAFNPPSTFERSPWQDEMLVEIKNKAGFGEAKTDDKNSVIINKDSIERQNLRESEDLNNAGHLQQVHQPVMQLNGGKEGMMYLRGMAYANYENNVWSILSDEQMKNYPENYNVFNMTDISGEKKRLKIVTGNSEELLYTPYYLSGSDEGISALADICILNDGALQSYELDYKPYEAQLMEIDRNDEEYGKYREFVYENYLHISMENLFVLTTIGEQYGIDPSENDFDLIQDIKNLVSTSASYSLETERVTPGSDIATWLFTDSDTGYCVHFATAAAMMLRAYGIPSRYVTGYYVYNKGGSYTTVTSDNAHAWVEYFIDGCGWVPLEATPASFTPAAYDDAEPFDEQTEGATDESDEQYEQTESRSTEAASSSEQESDENSQSVTVSTNNNGIYVIIVLAIILSLALALELRYLIVVFLRRRRFNLNNRNRSALYIFKYILKCSACLKEPVPSEIRDIAEKAKFSRHILNRSETEKLKSYADQCADKIYSRCGMLKKIYYKIIIII